MVYINIINVKYYINIGPCSFNFVLSSSSDLCSIVLFNSSLISNISRTIVFIRSTSAGSFLADIFKMLSNFIALEGLISSGYDKIVSNKNIDN